MFSRSSPVSGSGSSAHYNDKEDPHLEVTVTPCASAFYAGEMFSAVISFRNSRVAYPPTVSSQYPNSPHTPSLPGTPDPSGSSPWPQNALSPASEAAAALPATSPDRAWSPASSVGWRGEHARRPSGHGHTRRTQSLALGKGTLSPQEMVWALSGGTSDVTTPTPTPPPLPHRRGGSIPVAHPHARKVSLASAFANSPPPSAGLPKSAPLPSFESDSQLQDAQALSPRTPDFAAYDAGPSIRASSRSPCASPSLPNVEEESPKPGRAGLQPMDPPGSATRSPGLHSAASVPNSFLYSSTSSVGSSSSSIGIESPSRNVRKHNRAPTYHNAYGAALLSPPAHPFMRNRLPLDTGSTTVLWAHTRLVARFSPSHQYIPPDPLLPLKSKLLHQPIGSGSLLPAEGSPTSSRWAINFGTGSIGKDAQPTLTGSLFGLAKGLVYGGTGGSLQEERKRVWNTSDLPVLETSRSLLGVDIKLAEGETREFVYTLQLPTSLPAAFKGRALKFSYELVVSLNVALPGPGKRQRTKEITIPVRVWPNVSLASPLQTYDVLQPIIQTTEQATVEERPFQGTSVAASRRHTPPEPPNRKGDPLAVYARRLLETLDADSPIMRVPPSPSKALMPLPPVPFSPSAPYVALNSPVSPSSPISPSTSQPGLSDLLPPPRINGGGFPMSPKSPRNSFLATPDDRARLRPRATSLVGDDELVEEQQRCGEAVEILSRHSPKSSYDIAKDGEIVAVLTLIKTTYRLGETVLGVVTFNNPASERRVLKISAFLETHEVIPETLLPPSASSSRRRQPELRKVHAEHNSAYALHTARLPFSLDIPSDATPAFSLTAGEEGRAGGLEWRLRLAFLVAIPRRHRGAQSPSKSPDTPSVTRTRSHSHPGSEQHGVIHLLPAEGDADNAPYVAAPNIVPFMRDGDEYAEARAETVECEVPVSVLAGNTAFVVRPSVFPV